MNVAYDLDGVLAQGPPRARVKWGLMKGPERTARRKALLDWYTTAPGILHPSDSFWVITARKDDPDVRAITERWLFNKFDNRVLGLSMLSVSRTIPHVIAFKASVLKMIDACVFVEDNLTVLRGLKRAGVPQQLLYFDGTSTVPV